jgi:AP2 domain
MREERNIVNMTTTFLFEVYTGNVESANSRQSLIAERSEVTFPVIPSYRKIKLSQGQFTIVDLLDFDWLNANRWNAYFNKSTNSFYARRHAAPFTPEDYTLHMHREILGLQRGDPRVGDHISGDTLDNRRSNLRIATLQQNARNRRKPSHNTSGFKGVNWHAGTGKWAATIKLHGKKQHLGLFATKTDAYAAYCETAQQHFGEFFRAESPIAPNLFIGKRIDRPNKTGLRGVSRIYNRFQARISRNGKRIVLGHFDTAELAHAAYRAAAVIEVDDGQGEEYREFDGEEFEF